MESKVNSPFLGAVVFSCDDGRARLLPSRVFPQIIGSAGASPSRESTFESLPKKSESRIGLNSTANQYFTLFMGSATLPGFQNTPGGILDCGLEGHGFCNPQPGWRNLNVISGSALSHDCK